jgi:hypothetical protein
MLIRKFVHKAIQKAINCKHRTHYLKWTINAEFSIRYFFVYDDKPQYVGQFVLKSHYTKEYVILTRIEAVEFIQSECVEYEPKEYWSLVENKKYRRVVIDPKHGTSCFLE